MGINLDLNDEQARNVIRALSVHARDLAANPETRPQVAPLDALRHKIEAAVDEAE